ncbi:demethoxyubiquinone hydroxylase family protein [Xinfangfangia sp. D13-10-4-6]|uniref:demethoxyubiquinone hydroxylase family protein n=1 Tax=Pseudogemmobacter hezensis TaxID=2737662 RepID=UPI0015545973|nr:demethoxyubiquinone hydroxylase family protein [Pseudogemmobacter hezensis]NPD15440.1 demethoxyubiquinone hydroxylase family protein [Pseudogemmobacter hezensis]
MTPAERLSAIRIARVNHAGEYGAIRIYGAQIAICRHIWPALGAKLAVLKAHEVEHCDLFYTALRERGGRPCRAMYLWSMGGWLLGAASTLLGPNLIWACTEAVEDTVHHHLTDQLDFLKDRDRALHDLIDSIRAEEEGHLDLARAEKTRDTWASRGFQALVRHSVNLVIWLSTWGESSRMRRDLGAAA